MPEDCPPCSDEIKETCPDQDAATTSTCDVICDERYRSTPFLDKISTTGVSFTAVTTNGNLTVSANA